MLFTFSTILCQLQYLKQTNYLFVWCNLIITYDSLLYFAFSLKETSDYQNKQKQGSHFFFVQV